MGSDKRWEAQSYLLQLADTKGYVTFNNIMDCADTFGLSIQDFDWLTDTITTRGILVYDEDPKRNASGDDAFDDFAQSDYDEVFDKVIKLDVSLEPFISAVRNIKPPQLHEVSQLKYQVQEGNEHARNRMIEMHLRNAVRLALQRSEAYDLDIVDALGYAYIGLIKAVDKYEPDSSGAFASYASLWILQNISREQSTQSALIYYPVHKKEGYYSMYPELKKYGCVGCDNFLTCLEVRSKICKQLGCTKEWAEDIVRAMVPFQSTEDIMGTLAEKADTDGETLEEAYEALLSGNAIYDNADIVSDDLLEKQRNEALNEVLQSLTPREREVLIARYGQDGSGEKTLEQVGQGFGVTRERIRQIEAKAIRKLQHPSRSKKIRDFI